ncbi:MAG: hypothetical protein ACYS17_14630 [Planctomycetota bacterium]
MIILEIYQNEDFSYTVSQPHYHKTFVVKGEDPLFQFFKDFVKDLPLPNTRVEILNADDPCVTRNMLVPSEKEGEKDKIEARLIMTGYESLTGLG